MTESNLLMCSICASNAFPSAQVLEALYLQCCVWSVGATVVQTPEAPDRDRLDAFLKQCAGLELAGGDAVPLGALPQQSLYSFFVDEDAGAWKARTFASVRDHKCMEETQLEISSGAHERFRHHV